jgi:hypothetical protein
LVGFRRELWAMLDLFLDEVGQMESIEPVKPGQRHLGAFAVLVFAAMVVAWWAWKGR